MEEKKEKVEKVESSADKLHKTTDKFVELIKTEVEDKETRDILTTALLLSGMMEKDSIGEMAKIKMLMEERPKLTLSAEGGEAIQALMQILKNVKSK